MPWPLEFFTAPAAALAKERARQERLAALPYLDGLLAGDADALLDSFVDLPEVHHPIRGRIKGKDAFLRFVSETNADLLKRNYSTELVNLVVTEPRSVEEIVLSIDGDDGKRVELPMAIVADRRRDGRIYELRIYFSTWPLTGRHAIRPPLLQVDPHATEAGAVGDYQRALTSGDVEAAVAAFEAEGYVREPAGGAYVHRGTAELRKLYELFFSNGGGIPLEHCTVTDDGVAAALEYNVVQWGATPLPPEAGVAVYVRGASGKLAAARIYDDSNPPLGSHS